MESLSAFTGMRNNPQEPVLSDGAACPALVAVLIPPVGRRTMMRVLNIEESEEHVHIE